MIRGQILLEIKKFVPEAKHYNRDDLRKEPDFSNITAYKDGWNECRDEMLKRIKEVEEEMTEDRLSKTEWEQLLSYSRHRDVGSDSGWYWGNKEQFEKRHQRILQFLQRKVSREKEK